MRTVVRSVVMIALMPLLILVMLWLVLSSALAVPQGD